MSHFAKIGKNGLVLEVIVAEQSFVNNLQGTWIQTSYNTRGGVHTKGGLPLRKNFAGIGYIYNPNLDAFIPPRPYDMNGVLCDSWSLNEDSCIWVAPHEPDGDVKDFAWDEIEKKWHKFIL